MVQVHPYAKLAREQLLRRPSLKGVLSSTPPFCYLSVACNHSGSVYLDVTRDDSPII